MDIRNLLTDIKSDELRNAEILHLTANENQMSKTASMFMGSKLAERYYMGAGNEKSIVDAGTFTALGIPGVANLINQAQEAAKKMLFASDVNLNVLSGVHAMMSAILATTEPGDRVLTVPAEAGGHFATVGILQRVGRKQAFLDFDLTNLRFDTEKIAQTVREQNVKAIYLDVSYYLNPHNLSELRQAVGDSVIIIYDASHTMGLIMGQQFQAPLREGADVICANTHKTLPGPHKGMLAFKDASLAQRANAIIDGCLYSTPHMTHLIALSVAILEMQNFGTEYASQIVKNSNAIAQAFSDLGYEVRKSNTGQFSHNHQAHVFIDTKGDRLKLYEGLVTNNISTNFDAPLGGRLFIRIGTQEVTHRGMQEVEMAEIAFLVHKALQGDNVRDEVFALNQRFTSIKYSFDDL